MAELTTINTIEGNPTTLEYVFDNDGSEYKVNIPRAFTPEEVDNTVLSVLNSLEASSTQQDVPDVTTLTGELVRERVAGREFTVLQNVLEGYLETLAPLVRREQRALEAYNGQTEEELEGTVPPVTPYSDLTEDSNDAIASGEVEVVRTQLQSVQEAVSTIHSDANLAAE